MVDKRAETPKRSLRESILSGHTVKREIVDVLGTTVEIHQPTIDQLNKIGKWDAENKNVIALLMIAYCYVPGTNEHVFADSDYGAVLELPTGKWVTDFQAAWLRLSGIDIGEAEKNLPETS